MEVTFLDENILGKRLRWLRERKDFKQNVVAKKLDITPYQLSRYESGKSKPDPEMIAKFAGFYEVTADYLLGRSEHPNLTEGMTLSEKADELNEILKDMPEDRRRLLEEKILSYAKGLTDANGD